MHDSNHRPWWLSFALLFGILALFFGWYATVYFARHPVKGVAGAAIYFCLISLIGLALAPGFPAIRSRLRRRFQGIRGALACVSFFLLPYLVYSAGTGDFSWRALARLFGLSALPFGLFAAFPARTAGRLNWQDVPVLLWLIAPLMLAQTGGIWNVPVNLDFMARLFLLGVGSWAFLILRGMEGSGYEFRWPPARLADLLPPFAGFAVIAVPLGFALRFIAWNLQWRGVWALLFDYVTIFLFVALVEELFFRGLLQNLLEGSLRSRYLAQAAASLLFGLCHIRHAPFPNWRYVILATVAGWFYGSAYRNNRNVMAAACLHALVDTLWRTWLTVPKP